MTVLGLENSGKQAMDIRIILGARPEAYQCNTIMEQQVKRSFSNKKALRLD